MDLAQSTDQALLELKSIFSSRKATRGRYCEHRVARKLVLSEFTFLAYSLRTHFAEIDLVFFKNSVIHLIEVKSYDSEWGEQALSSKQALRLSNAMEYLRLNIELEVSLHLAVVDYEDKIHFYANILNEY